MSVTRELNKIVKVQIENMGYELIELKYGKRSRRWYLQIFADKEGGITVENCEEISKQLNYELDRYPDLLKHSYSLEVSSPGLERSLKTTDDFLKYLNKTIKLKLFEPLDNKYIVKGKILEIIDGQLVIVEEPEKKKTVELSNILDARLEINI